MASTEIESRIAAERQRLVEEEAREQQLSADRAGPLESGDDVALDALEQQINASRASQLRLQERIELLGKRLTEEQQAEEALRLDELEKRTKDARTLGEKILRGEYVKAAKQYLAAVEKLYAIDEYIRRNNKELGLAGRDGAESPNRIRCTPGVTQQISYRETVRIDQPLHPLHDQLDVSRGPNKNGFTSNWQRAYIKGKHDPVPATTEVELTRTVFERGDYHRPVYEDAVIPAVDDAGNAFWDDYRSRHFEPDQVIASLGL